ncbi:MAG TPA: PPC domain-containing DNA-binding protein [Longimicrobiales bacterium]
MRLNVSYTDFGFLLILEPGDEVVRCLIQFARDHEIEAAVLSGTGTVSEVELGAAGAAAGAHGRTRITMPLEACSLAGSITLVDGEPYPQLRGILARPDCSLLGGRVYQAVCAGRAEIAVQVAAETRVLPFGRAAVLQRTRTG